MAKICIYPECTNNAVSSGHCPGHTRQRKAGETLRTLAKRSKRPVCEEGYNWCSKCEKALPVAAFSWDSSRAQWSRLCQPCRTLTQRAYFDKNKATIRTRNLGLEVSSNPETPESTTLPIRGDFCDICGKNEEANGRLLAMDHNHRCCPKKPLCGECTRGFLCHTCNIGLGYLQDDPDLLASAILYLKKFM